MSRFTSVSPRAAAQKTRAKRARRKAARAAKAALPVVTKLSVPKQGKRRIKDQFYSSYEWKRVRYAALKRASGHCECCGVGPEHGAVLNVDHIKPRLHFPDLSLDPGNLQVLCGSCNAGKGNWDSTDWRKPDVEVDPEMAADLEYLADLRERGLLN